MISIIILNHNNKSVIKECLDSIIKFSKTLDYELIVVNNDCDDGSNEMLEIEYADKIRIFDNKVNGCSSGRNIGLRNANGEFILFLDSDQTVIGEDWLQPALKIIRNNKKIGAVGWTGGWLTDNGDSVSIYDDYVDFFDSSKPINQICYLGTGGMLIRKELALSIGGFDESYDPAFFEDTDFSLKIRKAGFEIILCRQIGIKHFPHQTTRYLNFEKVFYKNEKIFKNKWFDKKVNKNKYTVHIPDKILVLSYYNPFNSCGGQRPLAFLNECLSNEKEVVFIFESDSDMDDMTKFQLFNHERLNLLKHINNSDKYITINKDKIKTFAEEEIVNNWKPDLVISHVPVAGLFNIYKHCSEAGISTIYDQMDKWDAFPNDIFGEKEVEYVKYSTCITSITSALIKNNKERFCRNSIKLPNAVYDDFLEKCMPNYDEYLERCSRKRKKVLYAGALWPDWFDWNLLEHAIINCPELDFIVIGGSKPAKEENASNKMESLMNSLKKYPNVLLTGPLLHDELPKYFKDANAAIIPFISNEITKPCSPIKYYEYVSAILPVVSTPIDDLFELPLVSIADNNDELCDNFTKLIKKVSNLQISYKDFKDIQTFAYTNTWKSRYQNLIYAANIVRLFNKRKYKSGKYLCRFWG